MSVPLFPEYVPYSAESNPSLRKICSLTPKLQAGRHRQCSRISIRSIPTCPRVRCTLLTARSHVAWLHVVHCTVATLQKMHLLPTVWLERELRHLLAGRIVPLRLISAYRHGAQGSSGTLDSHCLGSKHDRGVVWLHQYGLKGSKGMDNRDTGVKRSRCGV